MPEDNRARLQLAKLYLEIGDGLAAEKELTRLVELSPMEPEDVGVEFGRALLIQGDYARLVRLAESVGAVGVATQAPGYEAELRAIYGHAFLAEGDFETAEDFYQDALDLFESSREGRLGFAMLAAVKEDYDDARERVLALLESEPAFAAAWSLLGDIERLNGNADAAEHAYTKAIDSRINDTPDRFGRALARISLDKIDDAKSDIEVLTRQAPRYAGTPYLEGLIEFQSEDYERALDAFQRALSLDERHTPALYYAGLSAVRQDAVNLAKNYFERYLALVPSSELAAKELASLSMKTRDFEAVETLLASHVSESDADGDLLNYLGSAAVSRGNLAEGVDYFERMTKAQPDSGDAFLKLGISRLFQGKRAEAIDALEQANEMDTVDVRAEVALLVSYLSAGKLDQALGIAAVLEEKRPESPTPLNIQGRIRLVQGDRDKARAAFLAALEIDPTSFPAVQGLAQFAAEEGRNDEARQYYQALVDEDAGHLKALLALSDLAVLDGDMDQSARLLAQAAEKNPEAWEPRVLLSRYHRQAGNPSEALRNLGAAKEDYPENVEVLLESARAELTLGDTQSALRDLEQVVELQPSSIGARVLLAQTHAQLGNKDRAIEGVEATLALDPGNERAKVVLARLRLADGRIDDARPLVRELFEAHPDNPDVLALLGWFESLRGQPQRAVEAYERAFENAPQGALAMSLALVRLQNQDEEAAYAGLEAWLQKHPDDTTRLSNLASLYLAGNKREKAIAAYGALLEHAPGDAVALNNLALLVSETDPAAALAHAERAVELAPEEPAVLDTLGVLLLKTGDTQGAERAFRKALDYVPENPSIRFHLAAVLRETGRNQEARDNLELLLSKGGSFPEREVAIRLYDAIVEEEPQVHGGEDLVEKAER